MSICGVHLLCFKSNVIANLLFHSYTIPKRTLQNIIMGQDEKFRLVCGPLIINKEFKEGESTMTIQIHFTEFD